MRDAWRLAVGTLSAVPVRAPAQVDRRTARHAMLLAPLAVIPLGALVALIGWAGHRGSVPPVVVAVVSLGALAAGNRALHWDGLSDTVDGLAASYDARRSLAVMRSGTAGPAGVVAIVVVLGIQAAALVSLVHTTRGVVLAGVLVCLSRCALVLTCARGVPGARTDGLGPSYTGTVPRTAAVVVWVLAAGIAAGVASWAGVDWWRALAGAAAAAVVVCALVRRTTRRFGGVTGDVFGAAIELALATLLVSVA